MIKRYDCYYLNDFNDDYSALSREAADGEWVLYDDHAARVAELEAENARLREALSDIASGFSCLQGFSGVDAVAMVVRALGEEGSLP